MEEWNQNRTRQKRNDNYFQLPCNHPLALVRMHENSSGPRVPQVSVAVSHAMPCHVSLEVLQARQLLSLLIGFWIGTFIVEDKEAVSKNLKQLFQPSSAVISVGSNSFSDGDFMAFPEIGAHKTKDKVIKLTWVNKKFF